jgi:uncharacterized protein YjbJ (UPF0337 family)
MSAITDDLKSYWHRLKDELKQQYADLTDSDLLYEEGKEDELYGRLQQKLGQTKVEVHSLLERLGMPTYK